MDRLHRTKLLLGESAVEKLEKSTVMIVGCGAVGSFACEALARSGIGHLILVDFDKIEESNINRQLFALDSVIGQSKVKVARQRIYDINPKIVVDAIDVFFDENTKLDIVPDFVIDAIDTVQSKIALYKWCNDNDVPFVSSMGAARKTDSMQIKTTNISKTSVCPLASKIRHEIKDMGLPDFPVVYSTEPATKQINGNREFGSIITVTGVFGLMLADFVIKKLIS